MWKILINVVEINSWEQPLGYHVGSPKILKQFGELGRFALINMQQRTQLSGKY